MGRNETTELNPAQLDELERLAKAASPGDWRLWDKHFLEVHASKDTITPIVNWQGFDDSNRTKKEHRANAALIVAMRNHLAALIALAREGLAAREDRQMQQDAQNIRETIARAAKGTVFEDAAKAERSGE